MKRVALVVAVLLLVPAVSATTIAQENITVDVGTPDAVTVERRYASISTEKISFLVLGEHQPDGLSARDVQGQLDCTVDRLSIGKEILCTPRQTENYTVEITYMAQYSEPVNGVRRFSYPNQVFVPTQQVKTTVTLPEGYGIVEGEAAYTPPGADVGSEGRRIFLRWRHDDASVGDTITYTVRYEQLGVFESLALQHLTLLLGAAVIVLAGIVVYIWRSQQGEKTIAAVFPLLKEDEKEVMRFIIDNEGEVEQRAIVDGLDYSKAKISRLVSDLEDRSLVNKEKKGRVNVVEVAREVGDVEG